MTDVSRDIGGLEARMDEHDKRLDRIEKAVGEGFRDVNSRLDMLAAERNQRKGAMGLVKLVLGASGLAGLAELVKEIFHR